MDHTNSRNHGGRRQWNNSRRGQERRGRREAAEKEDIENLEAIRTFKMNTPECPLCGKPIVELGSALADKETGVPVHFDCVLDQLQKTENLSPDQKIVYIGQGRFGVLNYENPRDQRHFTIKKIIEWEDRDSQSEWRKEISELYSKVN